MARQGVSRWAVTLAFFSFAQRVGALSRFCFYCSWLQEAHKRVAGEQKNAELMADYTRIVQGLPTAPSSVPASLSIPASVAVVSS